jgi:hypothetical protein
VTFANDPLGKAARGLTPFDIGGVGRAAAGDTLGTTSAAFAAQKNIAEQVRLATGGFGLHETATDRMFRQLTGGSIVDRAMRDAISGNLASEMAKLYLKPSATELAITKAYAEATGLIGGSTRSLINQGGLDQGGALAAARKAAAGSVQGFIETDKVAALASRSIGLSAAETALALGRTRFAGAELASSVMGLRSTYDERYDRILRDIAGVGSLGSIAAGLTTRHDETTAAASRLFGDVAERIERGLAEATGTALRAAHADLFPPVRAATRSEIEMVIERTSGWTALSPYPNWLTRVQGGVGNLGSAWVREDRPDLSLDAMTRFAHLGGVVANLDPREAAVTAELRARFGDYRGEEPGDIGSEDPLLRVADQYDRGFDPTLSSLPTQIVMAMLEPFGLRFEPGASDDGFEVDDLVGRMLRRLERRLMAFVQGTLETAYGDEWIMQVPGDYRGQMRRRRRKDEEEGRQPSHLIAYADFDWWATIIGHGENWGLFAAKFGSLDALKETMARIKPIRHAASHPRVLALEDLIMLSADGRRLLRWIGREH